ncbi:JmjC domain-containing protein [Chloropicon primus]|nr:JmjC domain-containing protein [Chloropicon primus]
MATTRATRGGRRREKGGRWWAVVGAVGILLVLLVLGSRSGRGNLPQEGEGGVTHKRAFETFAERLRGGARSAGFKYAARRRELKIVPMERLRRGEVSVREFWGRNSKTPIIVEGEVRHHPAYGMTWGEFSAMCGDALVQTSVYSPTASRWAGLTNVKTMRMGDYLEKYIMSANETQQQQGDLVYASGQVGIPEFCPKLELSTPIPRFVTFGSMPRDPNGVQQGQPEQYIGPPGTKTELHVDSLLVPFWMSVYKGSKTFRVITFHDIKASRGLSKLFLDKQQSRWSREVVDRETGQTVRRELEIWNPDLDVFPELGEATVYEGTVQAGDWIFLPGGAPHGVSNDGYSWGVSINSLAPPWIDNFADVCVSSGFKWRCLDYAKAVSPPCSEGGRGSTRADLARCLREGEQMKELGAIYRAGEDKDSLLHEIFGFESGTSGYKGWCLKICKAMRDRKEFFTKSILDKGYQSLEEYYSATSREPDIAEDMPWEQIDWVCAQCNDPVGLGVSSPNTT